MIDDLARQSGESVESYIETVLRKLTGFTGPKSGLYLDQKQKPGDVRDKYS